jgi:ferritin-like metal-binding protein YciE
MTIETMDDLFLEMIEDLYDAEKRLVKALPKMAEAATSEALRQAFESHLEQTRGHVKRLEDIFRQLGKDPKGQTCEAMKGLIKEGEDVICDIDNLALRDAALIAAANSVEHHEIAGYGAARTFAQTLGQQQAASLLDQTLQEEKAADQKLTSIAQSSVNNEALRTSQLQQR